jgi:hypothetical protein
MACLPMKEGSSLFHILSLSEKILFLDGSYFFAQIINPYYNYKFRQIDHRMPENIFQKQLRATYATKSNRIETKNKRKKRMINIEEMVKGRSKNEIII